MKRVLSFLLCCTLCVGVFAYRPLKANAVVVDATVAFGAATATAAINGTTATTLFTGMSTSAASAATVSLMGEYAAATGAASSGAALAGTIGAGTIATAAGVLVLSAAAGYALYKFITWLQEEKGLEAGGSPVTVSLPGSVTFPDGSVYLFCTADSSGTLFSLGADNVVYNRYFLKESSGAAILHYSRIRCYDPETGSVVASTLNATDRWGNSTLFGFGWNSKSADSRYHGVQLFGYDSDEEFIFSDIFQGTSFEELFGIDSSCVNYGDDFDLEPLPEFQTWPLEIPEGDALVIHTGIEGLSLSDPDLAAEQIMENAIDGNFAPVVTVDADPSVEPVPGTSTMLDFVTDIWRKIKALPRTISNAVKSVFEPDAALLTEITTTFNNKFGWLETLYRLGEDLLNMTADSAPPVIYIHLEDAEGQFRYGGTEKALDMSWYQPYKEDVDNILSGFMWLAFLWLVFKRAADIINGAGMVSDYEFYMSVPINQPRLEEHKK